jgi:hypothetical protein
VLGLWQPLGTTRRIDIARSFPRGRGLPSTPSSSKSSPRFTSKRLEWKSRVGALILDGDRIEAPPAVVLACGVFGTPRLLKASAIELQRGCSDGPAALSLADATEEAVRAVLAHLDA